MGNRLETEGLKSQSGAEPLAMDMDVFDNFDPSQITTEVVDPVDSLYRRFGGRCLALRRVLSPEECEALIGSMATQGKMQSVGYQVNYRRNDRVIFESQDLASLLWDRIRSVAARLRIESDAGDRSRQQLLEEDEGSSGDGVGEHHSGLEEGCPPLLQVPVGCEGLWEAIGVNECFRLCRYSPGGFFRAHTDGIFTRNSEEMSLFTCMLYLDSGMEGGATRFLKPDQALVDCKQATESQVLASVQPEAGLCLLFFQPGLLHEGEDVRAGIKHILRTEVMFRRKPGSRVAKSEQEEEALRMVREAQRLEEGGGSEHLKVACELYRRAFKLDPSLERMF